MRTTEEKNITSNTSTHDNLRSITANTSLYLLYFFFKLITIIIMLFQSALIASLLASSVAGEYRNEIKVRDSHSLPLRNATREKTFPNVRYTPLDLYHSHQLITFHSKYNIINE
jgi:hypothetical protein